MLTGHEKPENKTTFKLGESVALETFKLDKLRTSYNLLLVLNIL